jgi:DNA-binding beta-propeller fold protein YncE
LLTAAAALALGLGASLVGCPDQRQPGAGGVEPVAAAVRSPLELAFSPDGRRLAVVDRTARALLVLSAADGRVMRQVALRAEPASVAWSADGRRLFVSQPAARAVVELDAAGAVVRRLTPGPAPAGLALAAKRGLLLVADEATDAVDVVDLAAGRSKARVAVVRQPHCLAVCPAERVAAVANRLPAGDASDPGAGAAVSLIDLESLSKTADVALLPGAVNLRAVAASADGRWAYVAHNLARAALPTTQIEYGWINANALSVIDLARQQRHATILLDQAEQGAADPWGLAVSPDGTALWVALSGVHRLARLDLKELHSALAATLPQVASPAGGPDDLPVSQYVTGERSAKVDDPSAIELVVGPKPSAYGMGVYLPGIIRRFDVPGLGPRGVALSPDGRTLAVAMYFSGGVALLDAATGRAVRAVSLGPQPPMDAVRRGEIAFHDARLCHQQWLSCATCHPEGRADGLNWDLMNDGVGNPKNTRSLVLSHRTAPVMSSGARESFESAVAAGFQHILFRAGPAHARQDVEAYLRSLRPLASPFLVEGGLSEKARRGRELFEDPRVACGTCHVGDLLTDLKPYDVGTHTDMDWRDETRFVTPKLVELWRTAPYLHHGKAATLRDVLTAHNRADRHGRTSHLNEADIEALIEYLQSL